MLQFGSNWRFSTTTLILAISITRLHAICKILVKVGQNQSPLMLMMWLMLHCWVVDASHQEVLKAISKTVGWMVSLVLKSIKTPCHDPSTKSSNLLYIAIKAREFQLWLNRSLSIFELSMLLFLVLGVGDHINQFSSCNNLQTSSLSYLQHFDCNFFLILLKLVPLSKQEHKLVACWWTHDVVKESSKANLCVYNQSTLVA